MYHDLWKVFVVGFFYINFKSQVFLQWSLFFFFFFYTWIRLRSSFFKRVYVSISGTSFSTILRRHTLTSRGLNVWVLQSRPTIQKRMWIWILDVDGVGVLKSFTQFVPSQPKFYANTQCSCLLTEVSGRSPLRDFKSQWQKRKFVKFLTY